MEIIRKLCIFTLTLITANLRCPSDYVKEFATKASERLSREIEKAEQQRQRQQQLIALEKHTISELNNHEILPDLISLILSYRTYSEKPCTYPIGQIPGHVRDAIRELKAGLQQKQRIEAMEQIEVAIQRENDALALAAHRIDENKNCCQKATEFLTSCLPQSLNFRQSHHEHSD